MLCHLCSTFTEYMLDSKLGDIDRWRPVNGPDYELSIASAARPQISEAGEYLRPCCFTHYPHFFELEESATVGCQICALILNSLGAQKCLSYRRSGWPVRLCLLPISHGDQSNKRFRICIGKTTSPLTQTLLELEYYQRCERSPTSKHLLALDQYKGYEISHSASSNTCVQLALNWFDTCSRFHQKRCGLTSSSLPTRVLDVGKSKELGDADTIKLIATDEQQAQYVVLSHCWGPPEDAARVKTTTKESLNNHLVRILVEELPRNFQDAILVTRNLNIRYLWIDSLCIIQNLPSDWDEEAGKMGDYYERAAITISALCSPSSHTGFLRNRWLSNSRLDFRLENYENINVRKASSPFGSEVGNRAPLWKRAWVVQERCLSSRILHFGSEQMYWECRQCFVHEDGRRLIRSSDGARMGPGCFLPTGNRLVEKSYVRWYQLIAAYSKRALSIEDDRLPALGGIVVRFQKLIKSDYLAGIWKDDIIRGLLWCRKNDGPHRRVSQQRKKHLAQRIEIASSQRRLNSSRKLPSWSWAAIGSPVVWTPMLAAGRLSTDCDIIEARVTPQGPTHLGRVTEASIQLCGFLMQSSLMAFTTHLGPHGQLTKFENNPIYTSMDGAGSDITEAHFLYMANDTRTYYWLTLTQCTSGDQLLYKRVGILYANKAEHSHLLKDAEQTLVTIV